jgi:hypothetical protein
MKATTLVVTMLCATLSVSTIAMAQDKPTVSLGGDLLNTYYWRGQNLGGFCIQPTASIAYKGFALTAWGSVGLDKEDTREYDFTASYTVGGLSLGLTDYEFQYYMSDENYFDYSSHSSKSTHVLEGFIGYNFGVAFLTWYTNVTGKDYYKKNNADKRAYSTYIEAAVPFKVQDIDLKAEVGMTPWDGAYTLKTDKFSIVNIAISAKKNVKITDSFSLPVMVKLAANPEQNKAYFIFGLTL